MLYGHKIGNYLKERSIIVPQLTKITTVETTGNILKEEQILKVYFRHYVINIRQKIFSQLSTHTPRDCKDQAKKIFFLN